MLQFLCVLCANLHKHDHKTSKKHSFLQKRTEATQPLGEAHIVTFSRLQKRCTTLAKAGWVPARSPSSLGVTAC